MIKHLLLDIDGLVLKKEMYFSDRIAKDFGIDPHDVIRFFKNEYKLCQIGKADLKKEIEKYLPIWGWKKSVDELLTYWFTAESDIDQNVIEFVDKLQAQGVHCYLQTNNEKYRLQYIAETLQLSKHFEKILASSELSVGKPNIEFWGKIHEAIGKPEKQQVLVWDNEKPCVDSAKAFGFNAEIYTTFETFRSKIQSML